MTGNCSSGPRGVIHYAKSLNGPWRSAGALTVAASPKPPPVAGISNPTPYIFPNGTVIMLGRGPDEDRVTGKKNHNIFLYRAPSWNSTYTWVPADGVKGAINVGAGSDGPVTLRPLQCFGELECNAGVLSRSFALSLFLSRTYTPTHTHAATHCLSLSLSLSLSISLFPRHCTLEVTPCYEIYADVRSNMLTSSIYFRPATEDPHLYRGRRGFHVMFHSHPDLTHGWSEDGISWNWNKTTMGPPNHMDNGGGGQRTPTCRRR